VVVSLVETHLDARGRLVLAFKRNAAGFARDGSASREKRQLNLQKETGQSLDEGWGARNDLRSKGKKKKFGPLHHVMTNQKPNVGREDIGPLGDRLT